MDKYQDTQEKEAAVRREQRDTQKSTLSSDGFGGAPRPMSDEEKVEAIFTYHQPGFIQQQRLETIRETAKHLARVILKNTPPSADQSAALRKLKEATMTANSAIVTQGVSF